MNEGSVRTTALIHYLGREGGRTRGDRSQLPGLVQGDWLAELVLPDGLELPKIVVGKLHTAPRLAQIETQSLLAEEGGVPPKPGLVLRLRQRVVALRTSAKRGRTGNDRICLAARFAHHLSNRRPVRNLNRPVARIRVGSIPEHHSKSGWTLSTGTLARRNQSAVS